MGRVVHPLGLSDPDEGGHQRLCLWQLVLAPGWRPLTASFCVLCVRPLGVGVALEAVVPFTAAPPLQGLWRPACHAQWSRPPLPHCGGLPRPYPCQRGWGAGAPFTVRRSL